MPGTLFRDFPVILAASCLPSCCGSAAFLWILEAVTGLQDLLLSVCVPTLPLPSLTEAFSLSRQCLSNSFLRQDNPVLHGPTLWHGLAENWWAPVHCEGEVRHYHENTSILTSRSHGWFPYDGYTPVQLIAARLLWQHLSPEALYVMLDITRVMLWVGVTRGEDASEHFPPAPGTVGQDLLLSQHSTCVPPGVAGRTALCPAVQVAARGKDKGARREGTAFFCRAENLQLCDRKVSRTQWWSSVFNWLFFSLDPSCTL